MRARPSVKYLTSGLNANANGLYTPAAPGIFTFGPPASEDFVVHDVDVVVVDDSIHPDGYGGRAAPLSVGVELYWTINSEALPVGTGELVRSNRAWMVGADHVVLFDVSTAKPTDAMLRCRTCVGAFFHDPKAPRGTPRGMLLQGYRGDRITAKLTEDFTFLAQHFFLVRGSRYLDWISRQNHST